jgi:hypothetical protein
MPQPPDPLRRETASSSSEIDFSTMEDTFSLLKFSLSNVVSSLSFLQEANDMSAASRTENPNFEIFIVVMCFN